jgi:hypothetical protein
MKRYFDLVFWSLIGIVLLIAFGWTSGNFVHAFYFLVFFLPVVIATSWIFNHILVPRYLIKGRYGRFALYLFYLMVISLDLELVIVFLAFLLMTIYDYENISAIITDFRLMPVIMFLIVIISGFIEIFRQLLESRSRDNVASSQGVVPTITIRANRQNMVIPTNDIVYIESLADYVRLHLLSGDKVTTRETITSLTGRLPDFFLRIHRSYTVNMERIGGWTYEYVTIGEQEIPISRTYKKEVVQRFTKQARITG